MSQITVLRIDLHQFSYAYDSVSGEVKRITAKGDRLSVDQREAIRVYAKYDFLYVQQSRNSGHKQFNGHTYMQRHGVTYNIVTGKQVTNPQITGMFE